MNKQINFILRTVWCMKMMLWHCTLTAEFSSDFTCYSENGLHVWHDAWTLLGSPWCLVLWGWFPCMNWCPNSAHCRFTLVFMCPCHPAMPCELMPAQWLLGSLCFLCSSEDGSQVWNDALMDTNSWVHPSARVTPVPVLLWGGFPWTDALTL